jgi:septal ring factor EnvC (AmiA/AmiB activator)
MVKIILAAATFLFITATAFAQPQSREDLEKQRQQLKKELEQTEKLLNDNKAKTKENFTQWTLIKKKVDLQDRVIDNLNHDINILDNNMYITQKDINRYNRLLDTLKQEYAKSMVYAYKNRGNYDFMNFIFSAGSFNDAIKRIAYLKSYRNYREMQGENILRTQELRRQRIEELSGTKQKKNVVLQTKDKEMNVLESQKGEQDKILSELKKQGKQLNTQYAAKKKQMQKVDNAIAAAIKKALDDARKVAKKAADDEAKRLAAIEKGNTKTTTTVPVTTTRTTAIPKKPEVKKPESELLNAENRALNANFISNRGSLPWPVDKGYVLMHYGTNQLPSGVTIVMTGITVATDIGAPVKAIFDGEVSKVIFVEDMQVVIMQHGKYFSTYSNLSSVTVQSGQSVKAGQVIGKAAANLDGVGAVDFYVNDEKNNLDPEKWLRRR